MGIPSYFSYIIRNYPNIIQNNCGRVQILLMDCNSIIYDAFRVIEEEYQKEPFHLNTIEDRLIQLTIKMICDCVLKISPEKLAYITFDGVAPMAKMEQQRSRRYKAVMDRSSPAIWNTNNITPGTPFMKKLSASVTKFFLLGLVSLKHINIKTSCSDEVGEGEHKMFKYLRDNDCTNDVVIVNGLDADLIMLSIYHMERTKKIYIYREGVQKKETSRDKKEVEKIYINIEELTKGISKEMGHSDKEKGNIVVYDYILMCFLLGNDFLPGFPAYNIRTNGMQILLETYKEIIGKHKNRSLIDRDSKNIMWKNLKIYIQELGKKEKYYLEKETESRRRISNRSWRYTTEEDKEELYRNYPIIYREEEEYISVGEFGWEERYYRRLHGEEEKEKICENYLEGLEWVYKYYTEGCKDWVWLYRYEYAPLMKDLGKMEEKEYKVMSTEACKTEEEQLAYVMPNDKTVLKLEKAYKRYRWEM